jgi:hypothetical protein
MSEQKYPLREEKLYWLLGGDIFWYHFQMSFLKMLLGSQLVLVVVLNLTQWLLGTKVTLFLGIIYLVGVLAAIYFLRQNVQLHHVVFREKSKISDAWVLNFIALISSLMLFVSLWSLFKPVS